MVETLAMLKNQRKVQWYLSLIFFSMFFCTLQEDDVSAKDLKHS